jgi:membrane-associated phospholipid phosphatase
VIQPAAVWNRTAAWLTSLTAIGAVFSYFFIDRFAQQYTAQLGFRGDVREILDFIANLGHGVFCAFVVITVLCLDPANRKSVFLIALAPALAGAVTTLIKWCVFRPRPAIVAGWEARVSDSAFNQESFQSFPSGHTATAFALATALAMMYPHGRVYFYGLAVLVGVQRVLVQTHYPSDVLVGSLIGFVIAAATGIAMRKREARDERAHRGQQ